MTTTTHKLVGAVCAKSEDGCGYRSGLLFEQPDGSTYAVWMSRGGRVHEAVWKAGVEAAIAGKDARANPYYFDKRDCRGRISLGRRGFRNAWDDGYEVAIRELKSNQPAASANPSAQRDSCSHGGDSGGESNER